MLALGGGGDNGIANCHKEDSQKQGHGHRGHQATQRRTPRRAQHHQLGRSRQPHEKRDRGEDHHQRQDLVIGPGHRQRDKTQHPRQRQIGKIAQRIHQFYEPQHKPERQRHPEETEHEPAREIDVQDHASAPADPRSKTAVIRRQSPG